MTKNSINLWTAALVSVIFVFLVVFLTSRHNVPTGSENINTTLSGGEKQVLEVKAKGGYAPGVITAKAGQDSVLKIKTTNTYDCSAALTIPALKYNKNLPANGETEVEIAAQPAGTEIIGSCSMGMYFFTIKFS